MKKKTRVDTDITLVWLKKLSDPVVLWLVKTPVMPNHITIGSFVVFAPLVAYCLFRGGMVFNLVALGVLFVHSFLDLMDGEMVRQGKPSSKLGIWLEASLDPLMQSVVLFSIALHILTTIGADWRYLALIPLFSQGFANSIGITYSQKFKIDPLTGNANFHERVANSGFWGDHMLKNIIVPSHWLYVLFFTLRFHLIIGLVFNIVPITFLVFGLFITLRALIIYLILSLHYSGYADGLRRRSSVFQYLAEAGSPS